MLRALPIGLYKGGCWQQLLNTPNARKSVLYLNFELPQDLADCAPVIRDIIKIESVLYLNYELP